MAGMTKNALSPRTCFPGFVILEQGEAAAIESMDSINALSPRTSIVAGLFYFNSILNFSGAMSFCMKDFSSVVDGASNSRTALR